jgi:hypothetical protein
MFKMWLTVYLGMIRAQRRYEDKVEHAVFGLSTDHDQFHFLRINTEGEVSIPPLLA